MLPQLGYILQRNRPLTRIPSGLGGLFKSSCCGKTQSSARVYLFKDACKISSKEFLFPVWRGLE